MERTVSQDRKTINSVFFKGDRTRQKQEVLSFLHPARFSMEKSSVCINHNKGEETRVIPLSISLRTQYIDVLHSTLFFILLFQIVQCMPHSEVIPTEIVPCMPTKRDLFKLPVWFMLLSTQGRHSGCKQNPISYFSKTKIGGPHYLGASKTHRPLLSCVYKEYIF